MPDPKDIAPVYVVVKGDASTTIDRADLDAYESQGWDLRADYAEERAAMLAADAAQAKAEADLASAEAESKSREASEKLAKIKAARDAKAKAEKAEEKPQVKLQVK